VRFSKATAEDIPQIAKVHVDCWAEVYPFIPRSVHKARDLAFRERQWHETIVRCDHEELLLKLSLDEEIGGFAYCRRNCDGAIDADGELTAAYFLPRFRGGAVDPFVMRLMLQHFRERGLRSASIWVFDQNPTRLWYRALGWRVAVRRTRNLNGHAIPETGLICTDLSPMIDRLTALCAPGSGFESRRRCRTRFVSGPGLPALAGNP